MLGDSHDVEDVFQTTFLTLARKAGTIGWRASVANWLFGVAQRQSLRARANRRRRQALNEAARENLIVQEADAQKRDLQQILDAELGGLGERFRLPLSLCYLQGRTRDEAARQCGWSLRTLERRLEQGRGLLRNRFLRRGVDLSVVLMAAALAEKQANASGQLIAKTLSAAPHVCKHRCSGCTSHQSKSASEPYRPQHGSVSEISWWPRDDAYGSCTGQLRLERRS